MAINFSNQTTSTIIQEYEYRVQALLSNLECLEAQLEVMNQNQIENC